jgi:hypothetical protein
MIDDNKFQNLLSDYVAPTPDEGFSDAFMTQLSAEETRLPLYRRLALYGAGFIGGIIAALQLPNLVSLLQGLNVDLPAASMSGLDAASVLTGMTQLSALLIAGLILGIAVWATLDQRSAAII